MCLTLKRGARTPSGLRINSTLGPSLSPTRKGIQAESGHSSVNRERSVLRFYNYLKKNLHKWLYFRGCIYFNSDNIMQAQLIQEQYILIKYFTPSINFYIEVSKFLPSSQVFKERIRLKKALFAFYLRMITRIKGHHIKDIYRSSTDKRRSKYYGCAALFFNALKSEKKCF